MLSALLLAASLSATPPAQPASDAHIKAALELIVVSRTDQTFNQMKDPTAPMVQSTISQFNGCETAKPLLDEFAKKMSEVTFTDAQINEVRQDVAGVYADVFSQAELEEMSRFFKSEVGQKMLDRTPEVMQRAMQASQTRTQETMQKAGVVAQGFGPRLEAAYGACQANKGGPQGEPQPPQN